MFLYIALIKKRKTLIKKIIMRNFTKNILVNEWTATVQDIIVEAIEYNEFNDVDELTEKVRELLNSSLVMISKSLWTQLSFKMLPMR